jgi:hypothetical protein
MYPQIRVLARKTTQLVTREGPTSRQKLPIGASPLLRTANARVAKMHGQAPKSLP